MALPELRGVARILTEPRRGMTKTDKRWCSVLLKFPTWHKVDDEWEEGDGAIAKVIAFDDTATTLASYTKGDEIGIAGTAKPIVYNDKPQFDVTANEIWTPEKKAKAPKQRKPTQSTKTQSTLAEARAAASASRRELDTRLAARRTENAA